MAVEHVSRKPLDPMASSYHKIQPAFFYIYAFPPVPAPAPYYHKFPAVLTSHFSFYHVCLQPFTRKSPPPSLESVKKISFSLKPTSSGPRIPKSRRSRSKVVRFNSGGGGGGNDLKWRSKVVEEKDSVNVEKRERSRNPQRWKNNRRNYQESLPFEAKTTSVMIRNIPNKYSRDLLIQTLDNHCLFENQKMKNATGSVDKSGYDFLYLPIDFYRRGNAGFAFVNFTNPKAAVRFRDAFHGKRWDFFDSPKVAEISKARIQGKEGLINNCKVMDFSYGSEDDMPVYFEQARDGSGQVQMFTVGKFLH